MALSTHVFYPVFPTPIEIAGDVLEWLKDNPV